MNSIRDIPIEIMMNIPVVGNCIQHVYFTKLIALIEDYPSFKKAGNEVEYLIKFEGLIGKVEKIANSLTNNIQLVAFVAITLFVTVYFGFFPGLLSGGICLGSKIHSYALILSLIKKKSEGINALDQIKKNTLIDIRFLMTNKKNLIELLVNLKFSQEQCVY